MNRPPWKHLAAIILFCYQKHIINQFIIPKHKEILRKCSCLRFFHFLFHCFLLGTKTDLQQLFQYNIFHFTRYVSVIANIYHRHRTSFVKCEFVEQLLYVNIPPSVLSIKEVISYINQSNRQKRNSAASVLFSHIIGPLAANFLAAASYNHARQSCNMYHRKLSNGPPALHSHQPKPAYNAWSSQNPQHSP